MREYLDAGLKLKIWRGLPGETRVYINGRYCRGVAAYADGTYLIPADGGRMIVSRGRNNINREASRVVMRELGIDDGVTFDELLQRINSSLTPRGNFSLRRYYAQFGG